MKQTLAIALSVLSLSLTSYAGYMDDYGLPEFKLTYPNITGSGVKIALVEADYDGSNSAPYIFHANPDVNTGTEFSYYENSAPIFTGGSGYQSSQYSGHANFVASMLMNTNPNYGPTGVATGISQAKLFEANYFIYNILYGNTDIDVDIVHQSYAFPSISPTNPPSDGTYHQYHYIMDWHASTYGTLFVNAVPNGRNNNDTLVNLPGGMYNGITAGIASGNHSGPVHVVTNMGQTSESAPLVSGVAALLIDTARKGLTGAKNPSSDAKEDSRVIKSAILTGADKFHPWNVTSAKPLDVTYGAGTLNAMKAYQTLTGGQMSTTLVNSQNAGNTQLNPSLNTSLARNGASGWDLNTLTTTSQERVAHYLLDFSDFSSTFDFTATLTWNALTDSLANYKINNFDLLLVDYQTKELVWRSASADTNLEHIFVEDLASGLYDLQVILKNGGSSNITDTYALSYLAVPAIVAIPEPSSALLVVLGSSLYLFHRRRK